MEIKLLWKYIKYEVDQETWKSAKVRITGDANAEILNEAQTGVDQFDQNYCYRKVEQGLMNLQDILHKFFVSYTPQYERPLAVGDHVAYQYVDGSTTVKGTGVISNINTSGSTTYDVIPDGETSALAHDFTSDQLERIAGDNTLDNQSTYWIVNLQFDGRRNVDDSLLASELHKYVVFNVLQEWSKMAIPTIAEEYKKRTEEEANRVRAICYRKESPELDD